MLGAIFDDAREAMLLLDDKRRPVAANEPACRLLGRSEAQIRAERVDVLAPPSVRRTIPRVWRAMLRDGERSGTVRLTRSDGAALDVEYRAIARVALGRHLLTLTDATDRRRAETVRAATLDAALDAVITTNASGAVLEWNGAAARIFGYTAEQALGMPMAELIIPPRLRDAHSRGFARALGGRGPLTRRMETTGMRADGSEFPTELTVARTDDDSPLFIGVIRDLTDAKRMAAALAESESRFRRLAEQATDVIYMVRVDPEARFDYINPAIEPILGITADEIYADPNAAFDLLLPEDRPLLGDVGAWEDNPQTLRWRRRDGALVWTEHRGVAIRDAEGRLVAIQGIARDITAQRRAEAERQRLAQIVASSEDAILAKTPEGVITTWNAGAERLYGWTAEEAIGSHISLIIPADRCNEDERVLASIVAGASVPQYESQRMAKGGQILDVSLTQSPVRNDHGEIVGASVIARDLTDRKRMERQLRRYAELDMLTGLLNRPRFEAEVERLMKRTVGDDSLGAVIVLDIDHFTLVNDAHGHAAGDVLLQQAAQAIARRSRESDTLARIGVDEFAVLLPGTRVEGARGIARALSTAISECAPDLHLGASAGIVMLGTEGCEGPAEVMVGAGLALAQAKHTGPGSIEVYSGRRDPDLMWVQRVRESLATDGFVLHAQPIVDLRTGKAAQHELLLRMKGADGGLIPPASFLPAAERLGIVREIDRWVVAQAIRAAEAGETVEVNLSARSLGDSELTAWLEREVRESSADPRRLIFEITETAAIENLGEARALVERLTEVGCGVALDDFGTGFGSFSYLKHLPVTHLKIDMEFVRDLARSEADQRIVRAIVSIAQGQGMKTVGEGVEDADSLELLKEYGVDYAQGFYVGRPAPRKRPRKKPSRRAPAKR